MGEAFQQGMGASKGQFQQPEHADENRTFSNSDGLLVFMVYG